MHTRGFSLIEILIVIAVIGIVGSITASTLLRFSEGSLIDTQGQLVYSVLSEARSRTIASHADSQYGVHFATSTLVLFKGSTYNQNASTNATTSLSSRVTLTTNFSGGVSDVVFSQVTGKASANGTTTLYLNSSTTPRSSISIHVYPTGVIEVVE